MDAAFVEGAIMSAEHEKLKKIRGLATKSVAPLGHARVAHSQVDRETVLIPRPKMR